MIRILAIPMFILAGLMGEAVRIMWAMPRECFADYAALFLGTGSCACFGYFFLYCGFRAARGDR